MRVIAKWPLLFLSFRGKAKALMWMEAGMVEIEKFSKIEIEINQIKIFRTEIEIGFYRIGFPVWFFDFSITSIISKNYNSIYFDTKFNRCHFDKYPIVSFFTVISK